MDWGDETKKGSLFDENTNRILDAHDMTRLRDVLPRRAPLWWVGVGSVSLIVVMNTLLHQRKNSKGKPSSHLCLILFIILSMVLCIFLSRYVCVPEIDDVHPLIPCKPWVIRTAKVWYVIPKYNDVSILNYPMWCKAVREHCEKTNTQLGLHGYTHTYREFDNPSHVSETDLDDAIRIFTEAFGFYPVLFKAPNIVVHGEQKRRLKKRNLVIRGSFRQMTRKVYHTDADRRCCKHNDDIIFWF